MRKELLEIIAERRKTAENDEPATESRGRRRRPAPVAMGITGADGDYRVAVRVEEMNQEAEEAIRMASDLADGEVEVRVTGRVRALSLGLKTELRPVVCGCSCAHRREHRGTLGAFVKLNSDPQGKPHILSNNHVLARENNASLGDAILQPSSGDQGTASNSRVATLTDRIELKPVNNLVDAAVALLLDTVPANPNALLSLGTLQGVRTLPLAQGQTVFKIGCTTELTKGRISAWGVDNRSVEFESGAERFFDEQIEIENFDTGSFADHGDSGSLVVDEGFRAVGLLFGGSPQGNHPIFYANPISTVLRELRCALIF